MAMPTAETFGVVLHTARRDRSLAVPLGPPEPRGAITAMVTGSHSAPPRVTRLTSSQWMSIPDGDVDLPDTVGVGFVDVLRTLVWSDPDAEWLGGMTMTDRVAAFDRLVEVAAGDGAAAGEVRWSCIEVLADAVALWGPTIDRTQMRRWLAVLAGRGGWMPGRRHLMRHDPTVLLVELVAMVSDGQVDDPALRIAFVAGAHTATSKAAWKSGGGGWAQPDVSALTRAGDRTADAWVDALVLVAPRPWHATNRTQPKPGLFVVADDETEVAGWVRCLLATNDEQLVVETLRQTRDLEWATSPRSEPVEVAARLAALVRHLGEVMRTAGQTTVDMREVEV